MSTTRRQFLDRLALGAAAGALPLALGPLASTLDAAVPTPSGAPGDKWDVTWTRRLTGKHRVVFDVPEIESGYGVWRATIWASQYQEVLGVPPRELSAALVLRHNGVALAMQPEFWAQYGIGKALKATHPLTQEPTDANPALSTGIPAPYDAMGLDRYLARGGVALACSLALEDYVPRIAAQEKVSVDAARARARALLLPGVILQPSGVFAVVHAQDAGCRYVRAS